MKVLAICGNLRNLPACASQWLAGLWMGWRDGKDRGRKSEIRSQAFPRSSSMM